MIEPDPVIEPDPPHTVHVAEPEPPVVVPEPQPLNGLSHDWRRARAAWLYPGDKNFWIASHRLVSWTPKKRLRYLNHPDLVGTTHVIICPNTGTRPKIYEVPYNCLDSAKSERKTRAVFKKVIAAGFAPILWCCSQEFFEQELDKNHRKLIDHLRATCELLGDLSQIAVPFREIGDIYGGRQLEERNRMFLAMREGDANIPIACHERGLEQIPVNDFKGVSGDVISGLQTKFSTPTGGRGRAKDRVSRGKHTYDGAVDFLRQNADRMEDWQQKGRMERHTNAVFEHSLPLVYQGQAWGPTRTIEQARKRGATLLKHGRVEFDLSSGVGHE